MGSEIGGSKGKGLVNGRFFYYMYSNNTSFLYSLFVFLFHLCKCKHIQVLHEQVEELSLKILISRKH